MSKPICLKLPSFLIVFKKIWTGWGIDVWIGLPADCHPSISRNHRCSYTCSSIACFAGAANGYGVAFGVLMMRGFFLFYLQPAPLQLVILHACRDHSIQYLHLFYSSLSSVAVRILSYSCFELFILLSEARFSCTGVTLYLTLRRLMSYIYGAPILDVSRSHTTTQHSR